MSGRLKKRVLGCLVVIIALAALLDMQMESKLGGLFFKDVYYPLFVTGNEISDEHAVMSQAESYFGLVTVGDASIEAALEDSGITVISHVDQHVYSLLFVYSRLETYVYGH